ncbi:hypothetical protein [Pseudoalteromonas prydzensis]
MQDSEFTRSESMSFFQYAMDMHSPFEMAPVDRNSSIDDTYPLDVN